MSFRPPTRVLLLRHAESANPAVFHGAESDIGLSARGQRQAEAIAPVVAAVRPVVVVASAMRRALETAAPIAAACGVPLQVEPALHERRVGSLSGTSCHLADGVWPETLRRWVAGDTGHAPPGAESFDAIRDRVVPVWDRITAEHAERTFVVVAHGVVNRVLLLSRVEGLSVADWHRIGTSNVAINELVRVDGRWQAVRLNEVPDAVRRLEP